MMPVTIAAPSFVIPGTVAQNARALAGRVAEVGLCFFEAQACLAYTEADLPPDLVDLPLQWHVHLPVDLPWAQGGAAAAELACAVFARAAYLAPRLAVLHPPEGDPAEKCILLSDFSRAWRAHSDISLLLENIQGNPLTDIPPEATEDFKICLDVGHMLAYNQYELLRRADLMSRVALLHWSAPGAGDQHLPLTALTPQQMRAARQAGSSVSASARHMIEVFHLPGMEASVPVLADILGASWPHP